MHLRPRVACGRIGRSMRITCKALLLCRWPCLLLAIGIMDVNNHLPRIRLGTRIVSLLAMHCMEESWVEGSVGVMLAVERELAKCSVGVMLAGPCPVYPVTWR